MDFVISFFRDTLSGPLYTVVAIVNGILICAGIGYFAEKQEKQDEENKKYSDTHVSVTNDVNNNAVSNVTAPSANNNITQQVNVNVSQLSTYQAPQVQQAPSTVTYSTPQQTSQPIQTGASAPTKVYQVPNVYTSTSVNSTVNQTNNNFTK